MSDHEPGPGVAPPKIRLTSINYYNYQETDGLVQGPHSRQITVPDLTMLQWLTNYNQCTQGHQDTRIGVESEMLGIFGQSLHGVNLMTLHFNRSSVLIRDQHLQILFKYI